MLQALNKLAEVPCHKLPSVEHEGLASIIRLKFTKVSRIQFHHNISITNSGKRSSITCEIHRRHQFAMQMSDFRLVVSATSQQQQFKNCFFQQVQPGHNSTQRSQLWQDSNLLFPGYLLSCLSTILESVALFIVRFLQDINVLPYQERSLTRQNLSGLVSAFFLVFQK